MNVLLVLFFPFDEAEHKTRERDTDGVRGGLKIVVTVQSNEERFQNKS